MSGKRNRFAYLLVLALLLMLACGASGVSAGELIPEPGGGNTQDGSTGWVHENGYVYYYVNGVPAKGMTGIDGGLYYFWYGTGAMKTGWHTAGSSVYYFDPQTGKAATGWMKDTAGRRYYFDPQTAVMKVGWQNIDGECYYFWYANGVMRTGWVNTGNDLYYLDPADGHMVKGWKQIGNTRYCFDEQTGIGKKGWQNIDGERYYFWYGTSAARTGWVNMGSDLYYLDPADGHMVKGWKQIGNIRYYLDEETGIGKKGWQNIDGQRYYFWYGTSAARTGWMTVDGNRYYLDPADGHMVTGWQKIGANLYYLDENTGAGKAGWQEIGGQRYYFWYGTGAARTGWMTLDGNRYYLDPSDGHMVTGWRQIDGTMDYFLADGRLVWGYQELVSGSGSIRVACVGDSITYGHGVWSSRETYAYPSLLAKHLGASYQVINYGINGSTMTKMLTGYSYFDEAAAEDSLRSGAQIVVMMLGTNDIRSWNASAYEMAYRQAVLRYQQMAGCREVYIAVPPRTSTNTHNIIINGEMREILTRISRETGARLLDLYTLTEGHSEWFTDNLHPNAAGNNVIAQYIAREILGTPQEGGNGSENPDPAA